MKPFLKLKVSGKWIILLAIFSYVCFFFFETDVFNYRFYTLERSSDMLFVMFKSQTKTKKSTVFTCEHFLAKKIIIIKLYFLLLHLLTFYICLRKIRILRNENQNWRLFPASMRNKFMQLPSLRFEEITILK